MEDREIREFTELEELQAKTMMLLGLSRKEARIAVFLQVNDGAINAREIEIATGLRQPEVSIGLSGLKERELIESGRPVSHNGRGRPSGSGFRLKKSLGEIAVELYRKKVSGLDREIEKAGFRKSP